MNEPEIKIFIAGGGEEALFLAKEQSLDLVTTGYRGTIRAVLSGLASLGARHAVNEAGGPGITLVNRGDAGSIILDETNLA